MSLHTVRDTALEESMVRGYPRAYLDGFVRFGDLDLTVDERVYVPTPETLGLVQAAHRYLIGKEAGDSAVLDVGTGSGAIAIHLKKSLPRLRVVASDVSKDALAVARTNALALHVEVDFRQSDLLSALDIAPPDLVVANLPWGSEHYLLKSHTMEELRFMPEIAIFPNHGLMGSYVDLVRAVAEKGWRCRVLIETGVLPPTVVEAEMPKGVPFEYVPMPDYSVTVGEV